MDFRKVSSSISHLVKNIQPADILVSRADGTVFFDQNGKKYLDFSSQTLNLNLGQNHPKILNAVKKQMKKTMFVSSRFINEPLAELALELIDISPNGLDKVNLKLTNGSDANESAFKRVRKYHRKPYIISFVKSHLGESGETLSASGKHFDKVHLGGSGRFLHINPPLASVYSLSQRECDKKSLSELLSVLEKREDIAGIIVEPVMVNAGGYPLTQSYLQNLKEVCNEYGVALIFDEIQTAFGWLGYFFASQYYQVEPDIITLGKGLAAGFPLSCILIREKYDVLQYGEDEYTYGGHPISCAAALAAIRFIKEENLLEKTREKGRYLSNLLSDYKSSNKHIKEVRGAGLLVAVEFHRSEEDGVLADRIYQRCMMRGLVLRKCQKESNSLVFKPPIVVKKDEIEEAVSIFGRVVDEASLMDK